MVMHRFLAAIVLAAFAAAPIAAVGQSAQPKAATPKAAAPKAAPQPRFDARDPASLAALLDESDAKAEVARKGDDEVFLNVTTPVGGFGVQFAGCDANGKACKAVAFSTASQQRKASLAQINAYNQTSLTCRVFQDNAGKPHVAYSALLSASDTRDELRTHIGAWQGCLASFGEFLTNPTGYLAAAP